MTRTQSGTLTKCRMCDRSMVMRIDAAGTNVNDVAIRHARGLCHQCYRKELHKTGVLDMFSRPDVGWAKRARCRGGDVEPEWFFAPDGDTESIALAKSVCALCPVAAQCLEDATAIRDRWAVRAGMTAFERRQLQW